MRINNNMMAMNTHRQLGVANEGGAKSMEKLSSGMRINRAGDDAAGLAISEKMRGQIRGLNQASANSQDGISMIQTAEGALNETHAILQRMRELAVQSSTDTNTDDDRAKIQGEVDQLASEITRISNTTEFNTQNLMAGGMSSKFHIGANEGQDVSFSINSMDASSLGVAGDSKSANSFATGDAKISSVVNAGRGLVAGDGYKIEVTKSVATAVAATQDISADAGNTGKLVVTGADGSTDVGYTGDIDANYTVRVSKVDAGDADGNKKAEEIQYSTDDGKSWKTAKLTAGVATVDGMEFTMGTDGAPTSNTNFTVGDQYSFKATAATGSLQLVDHDGANVGGATTIKNSDTKVELGTRADGKTIEANIDFKELADGKSSTFNIGEIKSSAATTNNGKVTTDAVAAVGVNVSSQTSASEAITTINNALETVSEERSKMGAMQNRLEHTIKNLDTSAENLQASEARIRDVDMAKEMMEQTKQNILAQASTAMLANANQSPQSVLQLLG